MLCNLFSTAVQTKTSVPVNAVLLVQTPFVPDPIKIYISNRWVKYWVYFLQLYYMKEKKKELGYLNKLSFKQIQTLIMLGF